MPAEKEDFLKRLLVTFKGEAREHIATIAAGLVQLETSLPDAPRTEILDNVFRSAHSLKGAARTVNMSEIEAVCQALESVFDGMKRGRLLPGADTFDQLHQNVNVLDKLVRSLDSPGTIETVSPQPSAGSDTVRVSIATLDSVLSRAEELIGARLVANQNALRLQYLSSHAAEWQRKWAPVRQEMRTAQPDPRRISEFLDWNREFVESLETEIGDIAKLALQNLRSVGTTVDSLLDGMKGAVMLPFSSVVDAFPRFVRELSRTQGKEVDLVVRGGDIEIDRRILEGMKDALNHLVRNCLDHGLEKPAVRAERGKPARGSITISLSPINAGNAELIVSDDGAGIDSEKVRNAGVASGISENDPLALIFESGVSTSPAVTEISGRGLGLAIVKEAIDKLNGSLTVESTPGQGTSFRIRLPLTLSRFRGILIRVEGQRFVVSTNNVERVTRVQKHAIKTVENRETVVLNGETLSLVPLARILDISPGPSVAEPFGLLQLVVLHAAGRRMAFHVDEVIGEQEILAKTLGKQLLRVRNIAGATVLGNGQVALILHVPDLMTSALRVGGPPVLESLRTRQAGEVRRKSVLIAEDSITARTLLRNIVEAAGYHVETAVDGVDAFSKLRGGKFSLVVSDVDMPRMNGFGLTAKIRADKKFADTPVVLVTALDSRTDREHGIDVGADAYIVKSSFDQGNLLEVIRRLI